MTQMIPKRLNKRIERVVPVTGDRFFFDPNLGDLLIENKRVFDYNLNSNGKWCDSSVSFQPVSDGR